jgi:hypothetical protein
MWAEGMKIEPRISSTVRQYPLPPYSHPLRSSPTGRRKMRSLLTLPCEIRVMIWQYTAQQDVLLCPSYCKRKQYAHKICPRNPNIDILLTCRQINQEFVNVQVQRRFIVSTYACGKKLPSCLKSHILRESQYVIEQYFFKYKLWAPTEIASWNEEKNMWWLDLVNSVWPRRKERCKSTHIEDNGERNARGEPVVDFVLSF